MKQRSDAILPFHLFELDSRNYLIHVENMAACAVDDRTAEKLKRIAAAPDTAVAPELYASLKELGLLRKDKPVGPLQPGREAMPVVSLALFVTQACNLRCTYCYEEKPGGSMDEKTAFRAVDWLLEQSGSAKRIYITFFGGEPFLNFPIIKNVVRYANEKACMLEKTVGFSVTTNATLLDEEMIHFLKEHSVHILVSMDGPKEIQDAQRPYPDGRGSFDVVLPRVKKLLEIIPDTRVHAVLVDGSKAERIKSALKELGFAEVTLLPASASLFDKDGRGGEGRQKRKLDSLMKEMERETGLWRSHMKSRDISAMIELRSASHLSQPILSLLHHKKMYYACGAGLKYAAVSCSGDIYLCHRFVGLEDYKLGNVFEGGFERGAYQESPLVQVPACAACFARYYCAGGCKHDNAGACGSAYSPPPDMCLMKKHGLELAAALVSEMDDSDREFLADNRIFPPKPCPLDI